MAEREKLKHGYLVLLVAWVLLVNGLLGAAELIPQPPISGPSLIITVPNHAIVVSSNDTDCSVNQTDTFTLPQTPRIRRSCGDGVNAFGPQSAVAVTNLTTNPQDFWRTASHERNASITLSLSQSLSIVSLSFSLHTPVPRSIAVYGRRSADGQADLIAVGAQRMEDCKDVFGLSANFREHDLFPRCYSLNGTQDEKEATMYPIHVELPVVLMPDRTETLEEAFLALRTYHAITLTISGIGLDDARYPFMAMSDLTIRGRCQCNGHADTCKAIVRSSPPPGSSRPQPAGDEELILPPPPPPPPPADEPTPSSTFAANSTDYYFCETCFHQTRGMQCDECVPGFTAQPFSSRQWCIGSLLDPRQNTSIVVTLGSNLELSPELRTSIIPDIRWFKNGVRVVADSRVQFVSAALTVNNSVAADSGYYEARLMNANNVPEIWAATVCVQKIQLPTVSILNKSRTALVGGSIQLECVVTAPPDLDIFWTAQSGRPVTDDTRGVTIVQSEEPAIGELLTYRSLLTRVSLLDIDSGTYFCKARILVEECTQKFYETSAEINVYVCSLKTQFQNWNYFESDLITMWVEVAGCSAPPLGAASRWEIDNLTIGSNDERVQESRYNYTLQLGAMPVGTYQVSFVYITDDREIRVNTTLTIGGVPVVTHTSPRNVTATDAEASVVTFSFAVQQPILLPFKQFYAVEWRLHGQALAASGKVKYEITRAGHLLLFTPTRDIAGVYTVTISNALGSASLDYLLTVTSPPSIISFQASPTALLTSFNDTTPVNVTCDTAGLPAPSVRITVNGVLLQVGLNRNGVVVTREEAMLADGRIGVRLIVYSPTTTARSQGRLICIAQSRIGEARRSIFVRFIVLGVPTTITAPLILEQERSEFFRSALQWTAAETNLQTVRHLLCYRLIARGVANNPTTTVSPPLLQPQRFPIETTTEPTLSSLTDPSKPTTVVNEDPASAVPTAPPANGRTGLPQDTFVRPPTGEGTAVSDTPPTGQAGTDDPPPPPPGVGESQDSTSQPPPSRPIANLATGLDDTTPQSPRPIQPTVEVQTERPGDDPNTDYQRPAEDDETELPTTHSTRTLRTNPPRMSAEPLGGRSRASRQAQMVDDGRRDNPAMTSTPSPDNDREEMTTERQPPVSPGQDQDGDGGADTTGNRGTEPVRGGQTESTTDPILIVRTTDGTAAPGARPSPVGPGPPDPQAPVTDDMHRTTTCVVIERPITLTVLGREVEFGAFLQNLHAYSTYALGVRAMSDLSTGAFSDTYYINIPPGRPYAVENLTAVEVGAFHVGLRWYPPSTFVGPILHYTVTISTVSSQRLTVLSRTVQAPPYNASNPASGREAVTLNYTQLHPSLLVTFNVTAATAAGQGESTLTTAMTEGAVVPPTVPAKIRVLDASSYRDLIPEELRMFTSTRLTWRVGEFTESDNVIHFYQVLVVRLPPSIEITSRTADFKFPVGSPDIRSYEAVTNSSSPTVVMAYVAGELRPSDFVNGFAYYTAGIGNLTRSAFLQGAQFHNGPLLPSSEYDAFVRAFVLRGQGSRRKRQAPQRQEDFDIVTGPFLYRQSTATAPMTSPVETESSSNTGAVVGGVFAGVALLLIVIGVLLLIRVDRHSKASYRVSIRQRRESRTSNTTPAKAVPSENTFTNPMILEDSMDFCTVTTIERSGGQSEIERMKQFSSIDLEREYRKRTPIPVDDFNAYVRRHGKHECFRFEKEYQILSKRSPLLDANHSQRADFQHKNRYANIFAADATRIVLPLLDDDITSDYINANYIDGFGSRKEFISAQGPQDNTCADFWRMVWHDHVKTVVMLTRLEERGRDKCYQYWPRVGTQQYGNVAVTLLDTVEMSDFSVRTLKVVKADLPESELMASQRTVTQFQFTSWPDYGVPIVPVPLLAFLRAVREHQPHATSPCPIVVHCSAGIGRSGTLIAIDSQLHQAAATGQLDPYTFVLGMRSQRSTMVQTKEQYIFLYQAINEALQCANTMVLQDDLVATVSDFLEMVGDGDKSCKADNQFKILSETTSFALPFKQGTLIRSRSRTDNVPYNHNRVRLPPIPGIDGSDYINASYVDGWNSRKQFVAAETPSKKTQGNFWTLIWQEKIAVVVAMEAAEKKVLDNDDSLVYWPKLGQKPLLLETLSITLIECEAIVADSQDAITKLTLVVASEEFDEERQLIIYHFGDWSAAAVETYPSCVTMLSALSAVQASVAESESNSPLLLHCRDGSALCGTAIALMISLSQLSHKHRIDILQTVRTLRAQRVGMVSSSDLYKYIYQCLVESLRTA